MEFWHGVIIGLFIGANTGILIASLCMGCKRELGRASDPADWLHMDEAVMEEAVLPASKTPQPVITPSPHPFPPS